MSIQIVSCIIYRKSNNKYEFLLLKRTSKKGGFWQPPGGAVESSDKTLIDACFREVFEETGISKDNIKRIIENINKYSFDKHYLTGEKIEPILETCFAFEVKPDVKININNNVSLEHEEYKWVPFEYAINMLKWENNVESFEKLKKIISKQKN